MKRINYAIVATAFFTAVFFNHLPLVAATSEDGPPPSHVEEGPAKKPAKSSGGHGGGHGKKEAAIDPSKFEFYPNVQSINDLEELEEALPETDGQENVKVVYRTPDT